MSSLGQGSDRVRKSAAEAADGIVREHQLTFQLTEMSDKSRGRET